jgi:GGDEF domain-containing protein
MTKTRSTKINTRSESVLLIHLSKFLKLIPHAIGQFLLTWIRFLSLTCYHLEITESQAAGSVAWSSVRCLTPQFEHTDNTLRNLAARWIDRYTSAIQWFIPLAAQNDPAQLTRAQTVVNAAVIAAVAGPLFAMIYVLLGFTEAAEQIIVCCMCMFTAPFLLRWTGSIVIAREVFLTAVFCNFSWLSYHLGGIYAPTAAWLITGPVVAMFLGGVGCSLFWMCMSCAAMGTFYLMSETGIPLPHHQLDQLDLLYLACNVGLFVVMVIFMLLFELTKTQGFIKLERAMQVINELAIRDELTGSHNRRHLIELIENEKERTSRHGRLFCLCLLDIDFFKRINDTWGHSTGDTVLREFVDTVQRQIRETDSFGRYGGEEFLLMLPETCVDEALSLAGPHEHRENDAGCTPRHRHHGLDWCRAVAPRRVDRGNRGPCRRSAVSGQVGRT